MFFVFAYARFYIYIVCIVRWIWFSQQVTDDGNDEDGDDDVKASLDSAWGSGGNWGGNWECSTNGFP